MQTVTGYSLNVRAPNTLPSFHMLIFYIEKCMNIRVKSALGYLDYLTPWLHAGPPCRSPTPNELGQFIDHYGVGRPLLKYM